MTNKANRSLGEYYNTGDGLLPVCNSTASRDKSKALRTHGEICTEHICSPN